MAAIARAGLYAGTIAALLLGGALVLLVLERVHAAGWQWFKFGTDGHINLSRSTSHIFFGVLVVTLALTAFCHALARRLSLRPLIGATMLAAAFTVLAGVLYILLGVSQFNVWRA